MNLINLQIPKCCGEAMKLRFETEHYLEFWCERCEDVLYLKNPP